MCLSLLGGLAVKAETMATWWIGGPAPGIYQVTSATLWNGGPVPGI